MIDERAARARNILAAVEGVAEATNPVLASWIAARRDMLLAVVVQVLAEQVPAAQESVYARFKRAGLELLPKFFGNDFKPAMTEALVREVDAQAQAAQRGDPLPIKDREEFEAFASVLPHDFLIDQIVRKADLSEIDDDDAKRLTFALWSAIPPQRVGSPQEFWTTAPRDYDFVQDARWGETTQLEPDGRVWRQVFVWGDPHQQKTRWLNFGHVVNEDPRIDMRRRAEEKRRDAMREDEKKAYLQRIEEMPLDMFLRMKDTIFDVLRTDYLYGTLAARDKVRELLAMKELRVEEDRRKAGVAQTVEAARAKIGDANVLVVVNLISRYPAAFYGGSDAEITVVPGYDEAKILVNGVPRAHLGMYGSGTGAYAYRPMEHIRPMEKFGSDYSIRPIRIHHDVPSAVLERLNVDPNNIFRLDYKGKVYWGAAQRHSHNLDFVTQDGRRVGAKTIREALEPRYWERYHQDRAR